MNGIDLFRRLKQVQPDVAGVLITGALIEARRLNAMSAGMHVVRENPNDPGTLLPLVDGPFPYGVEDAA